MAHRQCGIGNGSQTGINAGPKKRVVAPNDGQGKTPRLSKRSKPVAHAPPKGGKKGKDMRKLHSKDANFKEELAKLLSFESAQNPEVDRIVADICQDVQKRGDAALVEYTNKFDGTNAKSMADLQIGPEELKAAFESLEPEVREALTSAAQRVRSYHEHQRQESWSYEDEDGTLLGQKITPLDRVGIYVPGGKAAYPSSVMMNAMPAHVAGVPEIVMVVPTPKGERNPIVLGAAYVSGVNKVFTVGGAQAIAALAYGTESIKQVDKVTGPGNAFVAAAKRRVFGRVGIDMVAGPSEILVLADGTTNPRWVAMDLFSQAEHDEIAQAILITSDEGFADEVIAWMDKLIGEMPRKDIIEASRTNRGAVIVVENFEEACDVANEVAPEHLEISSMEAEKWVDKIRHAGAIFIGPWTTESLGDYCAGPNHVLPTSRTARFANPLGVYDFQKKSSIIKVSQKGVGKLAKMASVLARGEGLVAHARAAEFRMEEGADPTRKGA